MRRGCNSSFDTENDFHILAKLRKDLKSKMRLKTASTHEEANAKAQRANTITLKHMSISSMK